MYGMVLSGGQKALSVLCEQTTSYSLKSLFLDHGHQFGAEFLFQQLFHFLICMLRFKTLLDGWIVISINFIPQNHTNVAAYIGISLDSPCRKWKTC